MAVTNLKVAQESTEQELRHEGRTFTDWLLSPSLYPSDERIVSDFVLSSQLFELDGVLQTLFTSKSVYRFVCFPDGSFREKWPQLKYSWYSSHAEAPGRVVGVRFLRTMGELPIWLDDGPTSLTPMLRAPRNAEIACLVTNLPVTISSLTEVLEGEISSKNLRALANFLDNQPKLKLNLNFRRSVLSSELPSNSLPYFLALNATLGNYTLVGESEASDLLSDLNLASYANGEVSWTNGIKTTQEELIFELRERYGIDLVESVLSMMSKAPSRFTMALLGFERSKNCFLPFAAPILRRAFKDLTLGVNCQRLLPIVLARHSSVSEELALLLERELIKVSNSPSDFELCGWSSNMPLLWIDDDDNELLLEVFKRASDLGLRPLPINAEVEELMDCQSAGPTSADRVIRILQSMTVSYL